MALSSWEKIIDPPQRGRAEKPRLTGLTMVIDRVAVTRPVALALAAPYVDLVKHLQHFRPLSQNSLAPKIQLLREGDRSFPRGTLLEIAVLREAILS